MAEDSNNNNVKQHRRRQEQVQPEPKTDVELYNRLYKFNEKEELKEYTGLFTKKEQQMRLPPIPRDNAALDSLPVTTKSDGSRPQTDDLENEAPTRGMTVDECFAQLFKKNKKFKLNKIQNAMYEDRNVREHIAGLKDGEDAIAFFAKYGNTTPIKFIHCVRAREGPFNPYQLRIVHNANDLAKVDEYCTVSPSGIVLIYSSSLINKKERLANKTPTEFISLSDWMRESTLFNILSNIDFFKNYLAAKVLRTWRENTKRTLFHKTREQVRQNVFYCKPQFVGALFETKAALGGVLGLEMVNFSQYQQKQVDFEEFKSTQKEVRLKVAKEFDSIFEEILAALHRLVTRVTSSRDENQTVEEDSVALAKHKPLNLIKREKEERVLRRELTRADYRLLGGFVRLMNYMAVETLVEINEVSFMRVEEEVYRERKNGLFTTAPNLEENSITFMQREEDIVGAIESILKENIRLVRDVPKILGNSAFEEHTSDLLAANGGSFAQVSPNIERIIENSASFVAATEKIKRKINHDFAECRKRVEVNFAQCRRIDQERSRFNVDQWIASNPRLEEVKAKLIVMKDFRKDTGDKIKDYFYGILHVDSKITRQVLSKFINDSLDKIRDFLYKLTVERAADANRELERLSGLLCSPYETLQEYCDFVRGIKEVRDSSDKNNANYTAIEQMVKLLKQVNTQFRMEDRSAIEQIPRLIANIAEQLPMEEERARARKDEFGAKFAEQTDYINDKAEELFILLQCDELRRSSTPSLEANKRITICKERLEKLDSRNRKVEEQAALLEPMMDKTLSAPKCDIVLLTDIFERKREIWETYDLFFRRYEEWFEGNIKKISVDKIEKEVRGFETFCRDVRTKATEQGVRALKTFGHLIQQGAVQKGQASGLVCLDDDENNEILQLIGAKVENMKELMPLLTALCNRNLKDKHWLAILEMIEGGPALLGKQFVNFQELIGLNVRAHLEAIEEVSARATGEFAIEQDLEKIKTEWLDTSLTLVPYRDSKDKFVLAGVTDLFERLDDHLLRLQAMLGSKFAIEIRETLQSWERRLSLLHETLEEWLLFQQQWMYLENVFSAEDIQRQLPAEFAKFHGMDRFWRETMQKVQKKPAILDNVSGPELQVKFAESNRQMELVQRMLEDYLELKRRLFPRFYFLSNDDLLEVFSQTRNPEAIQPHLRKCFDNLRAVKFAETEGEKETISAMISAEPEADPETVPLTAPVTAKGPVESWLKGIEDAMQKTLFERLSALLEHMTNREEILDFEQLSNFPAQIVLCANMIRWTQFSEQHIMDCTLPLLRETVQQQILRSVESIRGELSVGQRELIKNLIICDVHNRDTVEFLEKTGASTGDFNWNRQLRYYWTVKMERPPSAASTEPAARSSKMQISNTSTTAKTCYVGQTNTLLAYGFEYLGNSPRLVMTPLTDKCYLTLTSALNLTYGGAPAGPAGTGKTETTKDLAKAVAIQCIVFNCSDSLEYRTMGRFFSGLAQCGAWACFDEFNRIDVEVLSVIAQQIMVVQNAMRERREEFDFEGRIIPLNQRFGVFITMNPGYAGRSELPDNLKALFRPVAMMVPDYALIAEIMLFSEGFSGAKEFGRKLVQLFRLSSEQLSKQRHYDFGMRAVKAVLNMAGVCRRADPTADENDVLLKSMRDSNLPKFLLQDIALFEGIVRDLFPGKTVASAEYVDLMTACTAHLTANNLQPSTTLLTKVRQLYEVSGIRHGIMTVGAAASGKTTAMETLVQGLATTGIKVETYKLNPKAITISELFGFNDIYTNTFTHGIVSKLVVQAMEESDSDKKWIVFDGPVDAEWIENLNTVLDDNKMLCLPDGKRIKLPNNFLMLFEVENLNAASPATVSRCGMVYFDRATVSPLDAFSKFRSDLKMHLTAKTEADSKAAPVTNLFSDAEFNAGLEEVFQSAYTAYKANSEQLVVNVDYALVENGLRMFEFELEQLIDAISKKLRDLKGQMAIDKFLKNLELKEMVYLLFGFALVWSLGGNLSEKAKTDFSAALRMSLLKRTGALLGSLTSLFDFYFNFDKLSPVPWKSSVSEFVYIPNMSFSNILVETVETVTLKYFLNTLCLKGVRVLINGPTGVGKTSVIRSFLEGLPDNYLAATASFSAQTLSRNLENSLVDKLVHRGKDLAPAAGKTLLFLIDDINMPKLDKYGSQPVNELVRQIIDQGGYYDLKKYVFRPVKNTVFLAACAPPEGGRNSVSQRLLRHFHSLCIAEVSEDSYERIFSSILRGHLSLQPDKEPLMPSAVNLVKSTINVYRSIASSLLPTPSKCHYTFNMRDVSKVFQGMLAFDAAEIESDDKMSALWLHEMCRVFGDRLIDAPECNWFYEKLILNCKSLTKYTPERLEQLCFSSVSGSRYQQSVKPEELNAAVQESLKSYALMTGKDLNLVVFSDMVKHVCRIKRVLSFPRGHALLLGIAGSGKRALATLSAFLNRNHLCKVEVTRNYKLQTWRDDLKSMLRLAAKEPTIEGQRGVTLLMSEDQLANDALLEDVNGLLNGAEVPNLFTKEEIEELTTQIQTQLKDKRQQSSMSKQDLWELFLHTARENFHCVLTFSPVGPNFRSKCRQFPSLVNCCTIDYFTKWPVEALQTVAESELKKGLLGLTEETLPVIAKIATTFAQATETQTKAFYTQTRRRCYVTPAHFIDMLKSYIRLLREAQHSIPQKIKRYETGLQKLADTKAEIEGLQDKILAFQPQLDAAREQNKILLKDLEEKNAVAEEKASVCEKEAAEISQTRAEVSELRTQCQAELNEALPALNAARAAARNIDKSYISTIKTYNVVAKDIEMVLLALNLLFGKKESWDEVRKFLGDIELIKKLQELDPTDVPLKTWTKLRQSYLSRPEFDVEKLREKASEAIGSIANYLINMEIFYFRKREVIPKEQKLQGAEQELAQVENAMAIKSRELEEVKAVVDGLRTKLNMSVEKEQSLEEEQRRAKLHLERAEKLLVGLAEESIRWQELAVSLRANEKHLVGDYLLAAAAVGLSGPFNQQFREELLKTWKTAVTEAEVLCSEGFSLQNCLGNAVTLRDWQLRGLPADEFSSDNAVIVMNSAKYPLMIDPQMQMNKWLKNLFKDTGLVIVKNNSPQLMKQLENAVRFGNTMLIEGVDETLDSSLEPVLLKQTIKRGPVYCLKLNDQEVPFNSEFRLFLTTKLSNPHYLPDAAIKVNLVNCMVTEVGLENQLLVEIVLNECPKLEEQRDALIRQIADDKKQLLEIQARILRLINDSQGNLLDDEELINTLDASKTTTEAVGTRMRDSEATNITINQAREVYKSLATQGAMLYFIVSSLGNLNSMYQFSLEYFVSFFTRKMRENQDSKNDTEKRVCALCEKLTAAVFADVSQGLFGKHKLFFAFILAARTLIGRGEVPSQLWSFMQVTFEVELRPEDVETPRFLRDRVWRNFVALSSISSGANTLKRSWTSSAREVETIVKREEVLQSDFQWLQEHLSAGVFEALLILKTLREDKFEQIATIFVEKVLGRSYLDFLSINLRTVVSEGSHDKPIIFVLSPGADPLSSILGLSQEMEMEGRLKIASLGQGQGDKANELIKTARLNGEWVLLQNCHLAASWLPQLELLIESPAEEPNADFRLFLTTMPTAGFPVSILQRGTKLTCEPPKGVRANLRQVYSQMDPETYNSSDLPVFKTLTFCLAMFHATALERRKFGAIGWNIPYEWMNSDLETSQKHLRMYLEDTLDVPFDTLATLIGLINYGGRVTDYNDERVTTALLGQYFNESVLGSSYNFAVTEAFDYCVPPTDNLADVLEYIDKLPLIDQPELFGLHRNAAINLDLKNAADFRGYLTLFEPTGQATAGEGESDEGAIKLVDRMADRLPMPIKIDQNNNDVNPMFVFRNQEALRFNDLLSKMKTSLADLKAASKGLLVMSIELEAMLNSLLRGRVPENWERLGYPSLKPVSSWFDDLLRRVDFFKSWAVFGTLKSYWLSSFFFPQGFMTAVLQTYAREKNIAIDTLSLKATVLAEHYETNDAVANIPSEGVNVHGLFLENAHFDTQTGTICDALPKELLEKMPIVWLRPTVTSTDIPLQDAFQCPLYKTSERRGELSTTGHSTNFITYFDLPFDSGTSDFWVRRGVALLMQTDD